MINRAIRTLPFPSLSLYTPKDIRRIKIIPNEDVKYTEDEIAWMHRALKNLDYILAHANFLQLADNIENMLFRKTQIEQTLSGCEKQRIRQMVYKIAE